MSAPPVVVLVVVGLTPDLLRHAPRLRAIASTGFIAPLDPVFPAVTCTAQASIFTGTLPREHGIVANGWYFRDQAEIWLWRQSHHLIQGERLWDSARKARPGLRVAKMFTWYNMYSSADLSVTPRPIYLADGKKLPNVYSQPPELGEGLQRELGTFPLFNFWGPTADLRSSEWIAKAARVVFDRHRPDLSLVYLPHLDYDLQRKGPDDPAIPAEVAAIDRVAGELAEHALGEGARVVVMSEYGIENATGVVHPNRLLREAGLLSIQRTLDFELLDPGASRAFAVADHQVAHVYVRDPADTSRVKALFASHPGIERVLDEAGKREEGIDHARSGELVLVAERGHWFSYYYWLDDARAPDFARTVDIHRKPGYDPAELFFDPDLAFVKARAAFQVAKKAAGFRYLMRVIPLRPELVRGTHGRRTTDPDHGPVILASSTIGASPRLHTTDVKQLLLEQLA